MAKRQVYSFIEKKYSENSIAAAILSVLSVAVLTGLLLFSYLEKGASASWTGAVGLTGIIMAFLGLMYGFAGFHDDCKSYFLSKLGTILSTISIAAWFFVVCIGIAQ